MIIVLITLSWEQRKVSEVAEIVGGGTPSTNNSEYWDGDIDWYAPAEIGEQIYMDSSERKITALSTFFYYRFQLNHNYIISFINSIIFSSENTLILTPELSTIL